MTGWLPASAEMTKAARLRTIIKAEKKGHAFLADRIYSGVPAGVFGREQEIEIGHMSGESNVIYWLRKRHIEPEATLVKQILEIRIPPFEVIRDICAGRR